MGRRIVLSPGGLLHLEETARAEQAIEPEVALRLDTAFIQSPEEGLLLLASESCSGPLPPDFTFWRSWALRLLQALCHGGEDAGDWADIPPPPADELDAVANAAPPMRGLEYLTPEVLVQTWKTLARLMADRAGPSPAAFLHELNPACQLLGRVTFHLAENKRNEARPFAFMATFAHRLSQRSRVAHLPLAEALKTYAGAKDRAALSRILAPVERAAERSKIVKEMLESKALFAPQAWTIGQAHRFLVESPEMEAAGLIVRVPDWWSQRKPPRPHVQVTLGQKAPSELGLDALLDFRTELTLDGEPLTDDERDQLLSATEGLVYLRGKWVEANPERLQAALAHWRRLEAEHAQGVDFIQGMRLLAGIDAADRPEQAESLAQWSDIAAGDWLRQQLSSLRQPGSNAAFEPGKHLRGTLRPYQVEGVRWLWLVSELGLGGCLADDMGLGKTIQIIDLLLQRKRKHSGPPSLLVVPASLLGNWRQELERFAPDLSRVFLHRSECDASQLAEIAAQPAQKLSGTDLAITTYGLLRRQPWLAKMPWSLVILDEAQAIKNPAAAQSRSVKQLRAKARLALTGTPVENQLGDLWSIFDFCCPGLLGSATQFKAFVKRLSAKKEGEAFGALRRLVKPYILRRLKTDPKIAPDLPAKTEMQTLCGLSKRQAALYEQVVGNLAERLRTAEGMARRGLVLSTLMQLKQICNHPDQYLGQTHFKPEDSGKFERLALVCEPIAERQEKALVFTQFQSLTGPLAEFLAEIFGRRGLVLHGGTPVKRRSELVREFQDESGPPFFVVSVKAGGSGLNLTAASHVIHFDRWWNPAVENQATDRAFRIGQKRNVLVHKFVCRGTVEERIDAMLRTKERLADEVLRDGGEAALTELDDQALLALVSLDLNRALVDE